MTYRKPIDPVMSKMFYEKALTFERPFTVIDIVGIANTERLEVCQRWIRELVDRGELKRTRLHKQNFYEWIN